jgi:hypothetical protein
VEFDQNKVINFDNRKRSGVAEHGNVSWVGDCGNARILFVIGATLVTETTKYISLNSGSSI